ncbi:hypothetical protein Varpa_2159 [Variovorax paradoxus EPS]|uniref:Lipoprotein n=2 Tax=Variovorax paradoxus TaxID=34073 RepID=E6UUV0_VARPE|nr:hypothetical protein Varpa_2159 [Variovorax paradoxus EPS]
MQTKTEKISMNTAAALRRGALGIALLLTACVTQPPLAATQPDEAAASAPALSSYAAADGLVPVGTTKVRLRGKSYPDGFDRLRIVRRDHTGRAVAAQVALNVGLAAVTGRVGGFAAEGFSKDNLVGDPVLELAGQPWANNPGMKELPEALNEIATRVYAARAWKELERGRSESGWTREDMVAAAQLPAEADAPINPGAWRLVYENLSGQDELYRLQFSAGLALASLRFGLPPMPANCFYQSEPVAWTTWQADGWLRLREERAKALAKCVETLGQTKARLW